MKSSDLFKNDIVKTNDYIYENTRGTTPLPPLQVFSKNASLTSLDSNIEKLSDVDKVDYSYLDQRFDLDDSDPQKIHLQTMAEVMPKN